MMERADGVTILELVDATEKINERSMNKRMYVLAKAGYAFSRRECNSLAFRWFKTAAKRDAWDKANPLPVKYKDRRANESTRHGQGGATDRRLAFIASRWPAVTLTRDIRMHESNGTAKLSTWASRNAHLMGYELYKTYYIMWPIDKDITSKQIAEGRARIDKIRAMTAASASKARAKIGAKAADPAVNIPPQKTLTGEADMSKAKITVLQAPKFTCKWQQLPSSGKSLWDGMPTYGSAR